MAGQTDDAAVVRRGFEFFNAGDLDALVTEVFHEEIDYAGDPQISGLTGLPVDVKGGPGVRDVWQGFFDMFDDVTVADIELDPPAQPGVVRGTGRMVARGGESGVPIDALFHMAWVITDGRWRFLSVRLIEEDTSRALEDWVEANPGNTG